MLEARTHLSAKPLNILSNISALLLFWGESPLMYADHAGGQSLNGLVLPRHLQLPSNPASPKIEIWGRGGDGGMT